MKINLVQIFIIIYGLSEVEGRDDKMQKLINSKTIQERLIEIKDLISVDLDDAKDILKSVILDNKNDFYLMEIEYISNMIKEEEMYRELYSTQKKQYDCLKALGRSFYELNDYERAYYQYERAKKETNHPIFDYYLGKMLYKQRKYLEALPYFQEYLSHGGKKMPNCLLYMIKIHKKQKEYKKANKLSSKIQKLEDTFRSDIQFRGHYRRNRNQFYDHVKTIAVGEVRIDEEDFLGEGTLQIDSYDSYNFRQKLGVIKYLMQHQPKRAESYLHNLIPETEEEKTEFIQFQKNKIIYKNQKR